MESNDLHRLGELTRILLDESLPTYSLRPEVLEIVEIFERQSPDFQRHADIASGETRTSHGLAVSPTMAAMCTDDYVRTIVFLRGFNAAIRDTLSNVEDRPVRALYVGTGPYAVLAIPLMTIWSDSELVFEMIDIHELSIKTVSEIVGRLGLESHLSDVHCMDAQDFAPSADKVPDIVLAEIMLGGLENEPQVAVTRALTRRMPDALFLPETILIGLVGKTGGGEAHPAFVYDETARRSLPDERDQLPAETVIIPYSKRSLLETTVQVYGDHTLTPNQSGLTTPRNPLFDYRPGETVQLAYRMGDYPGLYRVN